jgi:hypothetical protein
MDLMKLLRLKRPSGVPEGWEQFAHSIFLRSLAETLRTDLEKLSQTDGPDQWIRNCRVMKVYTGNLHEKSDPLQDGYNYVFLNVPSAQGFMLEADETGTKLELRRSTLIVPLKRNTFDELETSTLFVSSPRLLKTFQVISPDAVRCKDQSGQSRTLRVGRMSEWLLSIALGIEEAPDGSSEDNPTTAQTDTPKN